MERAGGGAASDGWLALLDEPALAASSGDEVPQAVLGVGGHLAFDLLPQLGEAPGQEARDVHLGDAEGLTDLGLGLLVDETQREDHALALR